MKTQQTKAEWQNIGKSNDGYFLWKSADETGKPIYKYERTQPSVTEGGYYNAQSAAKLKNLPPPNKAQPDTARHSPLPWTIDNHLMIVDAKGNYIARIDASEKGWREDVALLLRAVNNADKLAEALRDVLREAVERNLGLGTEPRARLALADYNRSAQ